MELLKTYIKLIFIRHRANYLFIILSIISVYIISALVIVNIDKIFDFNTEDLDINLRHLFIGIRTVLVIGGISFIINQYYNVMKVGIRDYCILKALGATKRNIRILIFIQMIFLFIITVPVSLFSGYILTVGILNLLSAYSLNLNIKNFIESVNTFFIMAGIASVFIITIGIYLERGTRKVSISNMFTNKPLFGKEV